MNEGRAATTDGTKIHIELENFERNMKKFQQIPQFYYYFLVFDLIYENILILYITIRLTCLPVCLPYLLYGLSSLLDLYPCPLFVTRKLIEWVVVGFSYICYLEVNCLDEKFIFLVGRIFTGR